MGPGHKGCVPDVAAQDLKRVGKTSVEEKEQKPIELVPLEPGATSLRNREDPTLYVRAKEYRDSLFAGEIAALFGGFVWAGFIVVLIVGGIAMFNNHPHALAILLAAFGFPGLGLIVYILAQDNSDNR